MLAPALATQVGPTRFGVKSRTQYGRKKGPNQGGTSPLELAYVWAISALSAATPLPLLYFLLRSHIGLCKG